MEELSQAALGEIEHFGVHVAFEALGGLGAQLEGGRHAPDDGRLPDGGFHEHGARIGTYFAAFTAHDAGHAKGVAGIADEQVLGSELMGAPIEGGELFAGVGVAHHDLAITHFIGVESVIGRAQLQHHVVADVDDVVDGAHAGHDEAALHPEGRWSNGDPFDQAGSEARAESWGVDAHAHVVPDGGTRGHCWIGQAHGLSGQGGDFTGHADD